MSAEIVVLITCPSGAAEGLAEMLIEKRLAACVNVIEHLQSVYRWESRIQKDSEALLIIKTVTSRFKELERQTLAVHPYACPEIIALPIAAGHEKYLSWLRAETKPE